MLFDTIASDDRARMNLTINIDGGSRGNPGPAAAGVVLRDTDTGKVVHEAAYVLGKATNNIAEYTALVRAVDVAAEYKAGELQIISDSELLVRQITGEYRVKNEDLAELLEQAQVKLLRFDSWHIRHVKRHENKRADELVNMALDAGQDVVVTRDGKPCGPAPAVKPARPAGGAKPSLTQSSPPSDAPCVSIHFRDKPGYECPVRNTERRFKLGPQTPEGLCIHAAQAVFDEHITLWREVGRDSAQTHCARCGVVIDIEMK